MLIIENNSVYEIDEECLQRKKVPKECQTFQKLCRQGQKNTTERKEESLKKS